MKKLWPDTSVWDEKEKGKKKKKEKGKEEGREKERSPFLLFRIQSMKGAGGFGKLSDSCASRFLA